MRQPVPCHEKTVRYNLRNRAADRVRRAAHPGVGQQNVGGTPRTREPVTLAPVQPVPEATPVKPTAPAPPVPDVKPVEPVAKKNKPTEWKAASGENWDAATRGNTKLIKRLLADGMDVDVTDKEGLTALYRAAHNDQKETVSLLLSNGANVNIRDKFGNTPLDVTLK